MVEVQADKNRSYKSYVAQCEHYLDRPAGLIPEQKVDSPAAWRRADVERSQDWVFSIKEEHLAELDAALAVGKSSGKPLGSWTTEDFPLPTLSAEVDKWRDQIVNGLGFAVISGVPVEKWTQDESECFFWALGLHLGDPGAQNPQEDLLGHVTNTGKLEEDSMARLYQSDENIDYHCDAADVVGLLCLQPALKGGASRIASSVTVWNALFSQAPELARRLFKPVFVDLRNEHEQVPGIKPWNELTPCTYGADGVLRTFYHADYYRSVERHEEISLTDDERRMYDLYDAIAHSHENCFDMQLAKGDIALMSNHTIIHARTEFEDDPSNKRHLLRLWLSL